DVVRVTPGAGDEARIFPTTYGLADAFWRRTRARSEKRHVRYFSSFERTAYSWDARDPYRQRQASSDLGAVEGRARGGAGRAARSHDRAAHGARAAGR